MRLLRFGRFTAATLLGLSGCVSVYPAAEGSFQRTLEVTAPVSLEVTTGSGKIEVIAGSPGVVKVYAIVKARDDRRAAGEEKLRRIQANPPIEQTGSMIRIGRTTEEIYRNVSISYEIQAPEETRLVTRSGSGSQRIEGLRDSVNAGTGSGTIAMFNIGGDVSAHTGSGSIQLDSVQGSIDVRTGSGSVKATNIAGSAKATTGSGSISIAHAAEPTEFADTEAQTGSGRINLSGVTGSLRASTGSGSIEAAGRPGSDWKIHTSSGSVTLVIPHDVPFDLNARTGSGGIDVDHPVTLKGALSRNQLTGKVRGGGMLVAVQSGSGSISIR